MADGAKHPSALDHAPGSGDVIPARQDGPPPLPVSWTRLYLLVAGALVCEIVLIWLFSRAFA